MSALRMHGHCQTEPVKNFARRDIPKGLVVMRDCGDYARRFQHLGVAVRRPEVGDVAGDVVGIVMDREVAGLVDPERPGASDAGTAATSGLVFARYVEPVEGGVDFPLDVSQYRTAPTGDELGLVLGGPTAGYVRKFESGDIRVGGAVAVEPGGYVLVRLAIGGAAAVGGSGLA